MPCSTSSQTDPKLWARYLGTYNPPRTQEIWVNILVARPQRFSSLSDILGNHNFASFTNQLSKQTILSPCNRHHGFIKSINPTSCGSSLIEICTGRKGRALFRQAVATNIAVEAYEGAESKTWTYFCPWRRRLREAGGGGGGEGAKRRRAARAWRGARGHFI
jgi:hypothetical protein